MVRLHRWQNNVAKTCQEQVAACEAAESMQTCQKVQFLKGPEMWKCQGLQQK